MAGVVEESESSAFMQAGMLQRPAMITEMMMASVSVLPSTRSASALRPWPRRSAASALPPLPTSMASAMKRMPGGKAAVVTARPDSPTAWPRKAAEMML